MSASTSKGGEPLFQKLSFLLILALISAGFIYMVRNFVLTMLMAGVFTGLSYPLYRGILRRVRMPAAASLITLLILFLILVLPIAGVITVAYHEAWDVFRSVDFTALPGVLERLAREAHDRLPAVFSRLSPQDVSQFAAQGLKRTFEFLLKQSAGWSLSLAGNLANFFLMLFVMFYFYMDGERILRTVIRWSPLRDDYEEQLLRKFLSVSRATIKGILVVGTIQGSIAVLLFWLVGLDSPVFLGVLMVFCTVVPVLGTGLVWLPTAVYLMLQHRMGAGIAVIAVGVLIISAVDNFLRPILIGKDTKMHDLMVLLSTLGGLALFGLPGFIMGPVLASLFLSIWTMFEEVFSGELERNRVEAETKT